MTGWRRVAPWMAVGGVVVLALPGQGRAPTMAEAAPAYELVELPAGLDTLSSLEEAARRIEACGAGCVQVLFVWTARMPLSRSAIPNVVRAARAVGMAVTLVGFEELERFAEEPRGQDGGAAELAEVLLAAGALTHAPALVLHAGRGAVGPAILGYKTTEAYESLLTERVTSGARASPPADFTLPAMGTGAAAAITDFAAIGVPGAYFKWVPGRRALAYESNRRVYLLDLEDGENRVAPGTIDFVPTPDGRYFVTPGPRNVGLAFYDADQVFEAAAEGRGGGVVPIYTDSRMRDQYPSIGILASGDDWVRYRVLTSWFEGIVYRDYEIAHADGSAPTVTTEGSPVVPCEGMELSTPIMSQDGLEVAARDEASGTTKIFRFRTDGRCDVVADLGMPTRKVAWHASGRRLAFSTPRVRTARSGGAEPGIFLYDRDERTVTRVTDSEGASQLAFPDFVGEAALVFLVPDRAASYFRVVEPLP